MSIFKFKAEPLTSQISAFEQTEALYFSLQKLAKSVGSSALHAGLNQANRLMLECKRIKRQIALVGKPAGLFWKRKRERLVQPLAEALKEQAQKLASWLDFFCTHFSAKYLF